MAALGNAIGAFLVGVTVDRFGPKITTWIFSFFSAVFVVIQVTASSRGQLLAGKLLSGIPIGAFIPIAASYVSETAGIKVRGSMLALIPFMNLAGVTAGVGAGTRVIAHMDPWQSYKLLFSRESR